VWIRLPSLILGTASVPVVYLLGRQVLNPKVGVVAAGFIALSPFTVFYSTEARPYATLLFFVALSTLSLLLAVRTESRLWWAGYGLAVCGALYTHYTSVFVLVTQAAWALFAERRSPRAWIVTHLCVVLAFLPWLPHLAGRNLAVFDLTAQPAGQAVGKTLFGHPYLPLDRVPGLLCLAVFGIALAVSAVVPAVQSRPRTRNGRSPQGSYVLLILCLALATPLGLALYSSFSNDLFSSRNIISALPYVAVLVAWVLTRSNRRSSDAAAAIALLALGIGAVESFLPGNRRPGFRAAAHYIDSVAHSADTVMCWTSNPPGPYAQALSLNFERSHVCVGPDDPRTKTRIARGGRLFTVTLLGADSGPAPTIVPSTDFPGGRAKVIVQRTYPGFVRVRVLQLQAVRP
jgi:4-amino-4-deoxy-L-arabinose transferase-like glycosyltransferase